MILEPRKGLKLPSRTNEVFSGVPSNEIDIVITDLFFFEINKGCGPRPCRMCCWSSPKSTGESLPFSAIQQVHRLRKQRDYYRSLNYYYQNDQMYYSDGNHDFGDVAQDALELGMPVRIVTHGWIKGEKTPETAMIKLIELGQEFGSKIDFTFSVDNLGWFGVSPEIHEESAVYNLEIVSKLSEYVHNLEIGAYYNPSDTTGPGSIKATQEFLDAVVPDNLKKRVHFSQIQGVGRAKQIEPPPQEVSSTSWINYLNGSGVLIRSNGDIIFMSTSQGFPERHLNTGNIFTGLNEHFYNRILPIRDVVVFSL